MIFFLHTPKTAGTSVLGALTHVVGPGLSWYKGPAAAIERFFGDADVRKKTKIYGGHFGYNQIRPYRQAEDMFYAVIRDPLERVLSYYNYVIVGDPNHPLHDKVKGRSIKEAATSCPQFGFEIRDHQCYYVAGKHDFGAVEQQMAGGAFKLYTVSAVQAMIDDIAEELSVPSVAIGRHNVAENDYKSQISREDLDFIAERNQEDQKLFDFVKGLPGGIWVP